MKFKIKNCLLISFMILSISKALTFKSSVDIYHNGGKTPAKYYYDDQQELIGYKFNDPVIDLLYDHKEHVLYKKGFYYDDSEYYTDYFDFDDNETDIFDNSDSSDSETSTTSDEQKLITRDVQMSSVSVSEFNSFEDSDSIMKSSESKMSSVIDPKLKFKHEKTYYFGKFPVLNSTRYNKYQSLIDVSELSKDIERPYLTEDIQKLTVYKDILEDSDMEYIYYLNNKPVEFKFKDKVYVLYDYEDTTEDIKDLFGLSTYEFNHVISKCTNEVDILFLLDESEYVAEQEFNKMIDFCKSTVRHYTVKYNKARFAIVGYGSYGVKYLDFTDSVYSIMKTLDKMKSQQIRGKTCLGCGLSIATDLFKEQKKSDVKQILINIMASSVSQPTYKTCELENQTTYNNYCVGCCNKLDYEYCSDPIDSDCEIRNKVFDLDYASSLKCMKRIYNKGGYDCTGCFCDMTKKHLMCESCKIITGYSYKRCWNTTQTLACKSDLYTTFTTNYTESVDKIKTVKDLITINIGIGSDEVLKQVQVLSTQEELKDIKTDYNISTFEDLNMSIINDFVFSTCELFYDDSINECGKDCKGICGLNEKCYCPSVCSSTGDTCLYSECVSDIKNITVSGCVIKEVECPINPLKQLVRDSNYSSCCVYKDYECPDYVDSEGNINKCYIGYWDPNTLTCQYKSKVIDDFNSCTIDYCEPSTGEITHLLSPTYCSIPEEKTEELTFNNKTVINHVKYAISKECYSYGNVCVPTTYKKVCESLDPCIVCYSDENGTCLCENIVYEDGQCTNGYKVSFVDKFDYPMMVKAAEHCVEFDNINNEGYIQSYTSKDYLKVVDGRIKICYKSEYLKDYQTVECQTDELFTAYLDSNYSCIKVPKLPVYKTEDDIIDKCSVLSYGYNYSFTYTTKECVSKCFESHCNKETGNCEISQQKEYQLEYDKQTKDIKCDEDVGFYFVDKVINEIYNCYSNDLCYISFSSVDNKCLDSRLITPLTKDPECFEYSCVNGTLQEELLYYQFTDICSPCVAKYGDLLEMFEGKICYYHLTRYVKKAMDFIFIFITVISIILSTIVSVVISFIRIKRKKGYVKLEDIKEVELEDKPAEEDKTN